MALKSISVMVIALCFVSVWSCSNQSYVETVVREKAPQIDINMYQEVKQYLESEVEACGSGVIDSTKTDNKCSYHIEVNQEMVERFKTGYIPKKHTGNGQYWVMPTEAEMKAVPEKWSIRDYGKAADFHAAKQLWNDCWANATANVFSLLASAMDKVLTFMSVQAVIDCSGEGSASSGGYMTAKNMLVKYGLVTRDKYPYNGKDNRCKYSKSELEKGLDYKLKGAPWVGSSFMYSKGNNTRAVPTAKMMQAAAIRDNSPLLVTVDAYDISGPGIYNNCSAINSGGNHMVGIEGWFTKDGKDIAQVTNSWGPNHGVDGVSNIQWECGGAGRLNRGLGVEAATYQYDAKCPMPVPETGPDQTIIKTTPGVGVLIGMEAKEKETCVWAPKEGLDNPNACKTFASPDITTEYHLTVSNECGESTAMVMVNVLGPKLEKSVIIKTPFGLIKGE